MTPKEALEAIRKELQDRLDFPINLTPEYRLVKQSLNELEALKKDVARFIKLVYKPTWLNTFESADYDYLKNKLSKAGKEK